MRRYVLIRVLFMLSNVFFIATVLFFALTLANFNKWMKDPLPFLDYIKMTTRLYKVFLRERFVKWDWGVTIFGDKVVDVVVPRFWITMKYNMLALFTYVPVGMLVGLLSAYFKDSFFDRVVNTITLIFGSIPHYILAFLLITILGYQLQLFPPHFSQIKDTFFGEIMGYGIPIIALSIGAINKVSRVIRAEIIDLSQSEFFLLSRTKGLSKRQIFIRHFLKNSIVAVLPVLINVFMLVLTGSFFLEMVFGIEGVGEILYHSLIKLDKETGISYVLIDVNTTVLIGLFYMVLASVFGLIVDIIYPIIDPRINIAGVSVEKQ